MKFLYIAFFGIIVVLFLGNVGYPHPINADLAVRRITVDSDFNGFDMLIFGALDVKGDLIILIHGPKRSLIINKKEKKYGFWVNGKREKLDDIKQFYAVTSTNNLSSITDDESLKLIRISDLNFSEDQELDSAFKRMKDNNGLYFESIKNIDLINEKLFRTNIKFPSNISKGRYIIEILLFYNKNLFGVQTIPLLVSNVGIESFVFDMHDFHPVLYGLCSVIGALLIGWISSIVKRRKNKKISFVCTRK